MAVAGSTAAGQTASGDTAGQGPTITAVLRDTSEVTQDYARLDIHFSAQASQNKELLQILQSVSKLTMNSEVSTEFLSSLSS